METNQFIKELIYKRVIITSYPKHFDNWNDIINIKYLTRYIDYKCGKPLKCTSETSPRCCCSGCAYNIGYLQEVPTSLDVLDIYASLFEKDVGFWSKVGCRLPRLLRSVTCLGYSCYFEQISTIDLLILDILRYGINHKKVRQRIKEFVPNSITKYRNYRTYVDQYTFIKGYLEIHNMKPLRHDPFLRVIRQLSSNYNTHFESVLNASY